MISKWSIIGYIAGFLFSLFSAIRYFIVWPDTDRAIVYVLLGFLICAISWLYNQNLNNCNLIDAIQDHLEHGKEKQ